MGAARPYIGQVTCQGEGALQQILLSFIIVVLWKIRGTSYQCIRFASLRSGSINQFKVESRKEFAPSGLTTAKPLNRHEMLQILVVTDHFYRNPCSFEFGSPLLESSYNSHQFLIVDMVVTLGRR
jgi:hypothetical protein